MKKSNQITEFYKTHPRPVYPPAPEREEALVDVARLYQLAQDFIEDQEDESSEE